ncbi:hypothetical protein C7271_16525, partial [filamentous cyanobacterium CCP5]
MEVLGFLAAWDIYEQACADLETSRGELASQRLMDEWLHSQEKASSKVSNVVKASLILACMPLLEIVAFSSQAIATSTPEAPKPTTSEDTAAQSPPTEVAVEPIHLAATKLSVLEPPKPVVEASPMAAAPVAPASPAPQSQEKIAPTLPADHSPTDHLTADQRSSQSAPIAAVDSPDSPTPAIGTSRPEVADSGNASSSPVAQRPKSELPPSAEIGSQTLPPGAVPLARVLSP